MNNSKYTALVNNLVSQGVNFELSVFNRNSGENCGVDWNELAKKYGYRKPKTGISAAVVISTCYCSGFTETLINSV